MYWRESIKKSYLFLIINIIICAFISMRYLTHIDYITAMSGTFIGFASIGHYFSMVLLLFIGLFLPLSLLYRFPKILNTLTVMIGATMITILTIDTFVFQLYRFHINGFVLGLLFGEGAGEIFHIGLGTYITGICSIGGIILLEVGALLLANKLTKLFTRRTVRRITCTGIVLLLGVNIMYAYADAMLYRPIMKAKRVFPLFYPLTAKSFLYSHFIDESKVADEPEIRLSSNKSLDYPKAPIKTSACKKNIVVLMIDSWHFECMTKEITPNIYNFSKENMVFTRHNSGSNATRGSVFSLFYSIPPFYWDDMKSSRTSPVFFDVLKEYNYQIQTFPSATLRNPAFYRTVFQSIDGLNLETEGKNSNIRDENITKNFTRFLKTERDTARPFFSFIFYDSAHAIAHPKDYKGPFQPEWDYPKYEKLSDPSVKEEYYNLYKNSVHYIDHLTKDIFQTLKEKDLLKNTIVIVTGDHGQEFNDNHKNYWGHGGNFTKYQTQIPMIVHNPGDTAKVYNHLTTHYDIVPTLLQNEFNCTTDIKAYSVGANMFSTQKREPIVMGTKLNFAFVDTDRITCIDYDGTYDITDLNLNPMDTVSIDAKLLNETMTTINRYYQQ
ncbi:DUF3413 domain-containing protein [Halosquirtibacter xylanolyticus]|uniref:DUF3413 domain-containing protein n=1 Tax=Halosquirtibacter xylanolyticus TaxID=3374599 RepID=UPI003749EEC9|nr:DUF3413 domain-containing protein [Prolixibacteraceae bacterium]